MTDDVNGNKPLLDGPPTTVELQASQAVSKSGRCKFTMACMLARKIALYDYVQAMQQAAQCMCSAPLARCRETYLLTSLLGASKAVVEEHQDGGEDREEGSKAHHHCIACTLA